MLLKINSQHLFSLDYCSFIHTVEQVGSAVFHRPGGVFSCSEFMAWRLWSWLGWAELLTTAAYCAKVLALLFHRVLTLETEKPCFCTAVHPHQYACSPSGNMLALSGQLEAVHGDKLSAGLS